MRQFPRRTKIVATLLLGGFLVACVMLRNQAPDAMDRGLTFDHALHVDQGMDCTDCHDLGVENPVSPNHDVCGMCHDIPGTEAPEEEADREACAMCHERPDYSVSPRAPRLSRERKFSHVPHLDAEVACTVCHDEANRALPKGDLMAFCMDCHEKTDPEMNACSVCHTRLSRETAPQFRRGMRIAHDAPEVWELVHGREARVDEAYCAICHEGETDCAECHRRTPPTSHTVTWRRRTHGLQAEWDRRKCAVCHEEDSCARCHGNNEPSSHRSGFGSPVNSHCVQCHFPQQDNNCTECHESIDHRQARSSPHARGVFPADCGRCHPGGLPQRAPHPLNNSVRCVVCHK